MKQSAVDSSGELELWGGLECTVNRVGDRYTDQVELSGHHLRISDLDLFAGLGLSALRYPILWERIVADGVNYDWAWSDQRIERLREHGIRPIAGLIHHGSGPRLTDLLDDGFAVNLADYAAHVAQRYPWIDEWTPVNEPLTTARFAALYGFWYPHRRDEASFWTALVNQVDGVRLSMRAIRRINPAARLIQTDDLGRTYATAAVRDQAAFDNVRRWASWDMLCGRIVPGHPLWKRLSGFGLERRLREIAVDPCPPDVIGINHYLTSDRFLDHRTQRYPQHLRGGNGHLRYADTEAVRVLQPPPPGLRAALREAWDRYNIPVAITEVHNGCTRDEQMRWTAAAWDAASELRNNGVPVVAVTSWALLGSTGWNTLLTQPEGRYECGVFDVSAGGEPRPTAMTTLLRGLRRKRPRHPVVAGAGWWRRPLRLVHPPVQRPAPMHDYLMGGVPAMPPRPLLICGATGTLGRALASACRHRDIAHILTGRAECDLHNPVSIAAALDRNQPWAVINATGWVRVDDAETEADACHAINAEGAVLLARACAERGIPSVTFSSDLVFDGSVSRPYVESDGTSPLSVYGRSKHMAETGIGRLNGTHLVVRTAAFFSPLDVYNFAHHVACALGEGNRFTAAEDAVISPTYVPQLCNAVLDLAIDGSGGIWHLTNGEAVSWAEFARQLARACALDERLVQGVPGASLGWAARRPPYSAMISERAILLPPLNEAIIDFAAQLRERAVAGVLV
jgi:dTDP-4-dehydrorhamnose reductase